MNKFKRIFFEETEHYDGYVDGAPTYKTVTQLRDWCGILISGVAIGVAVVVGIAVFLVIPIRGIDVRVNHSKCKSYEAKTGIATKWEEFNWFDYTCLGQTPSGKWIDIDNFKQDNT